MTSESLPISIRAPLHKTQQDVAKHGWQQALDIATWHRDDPRRNWPPEVFGALRSGGGTGNLDHTLHRLSLSLEKSSKRKIENVTKLIGTLTFIFASVCVAFVMISVVTATLSGISK